MSNFFQLKDDGDSGRLTLISEPEISEEKNKGVVSVKINLPVKFNGKVKMWNASPKVLEAMIAANVNEGDTFDVVRKGAKGDKETTYQISRVA